MIKPLTFDGSRLSSTYSHPQALSTRRLRRPVPVTLGSTIWLVLLELPLRILPRRYVARSYIFASHLFSNPMPWQIRFALSSSSVFSRSDTVTDSERFYNSLLEILDDPAEKIEVEALLNWWNQWVVCSCCAIVANFECMHISTAKYSQVLLWCYARRRRTGRRPKSVRSKLRLVKGSRSR